MRSGNRGDQLEIGLSPLWSVCDALLAPLERLDVLIRLDLGEAEGWENGRPSEEYECSKESS